MGITCVVNANEEFLEIAVVTRILDTLETRRMALGCGKIA